MKIKFYTRGHEENFRHLCTRYEIDLRNRDHVLLLYLLASIRESEYCVDDVIECDRPGHINIKPDVLSNGWVTSGYARIIRLALHLFTWHSPTVQEGDKIENYLPMELLMGLDTKHTQAALESLQMLCFWSDYECDNN